MSGQPQGGRDDDLIAAWATLSEGVERPVRRPSTPAARISVVPIVGTLVVAAILVAALATARPDVLRPPPATPGPGASGALTEAPSTSPGSTIVPVPAAVELLPRTARTPDCTHHDRSWIVRIQSGERFWEVFPAAEDNPELRRVEEPMLVSTYPGGWKMGATGMGTPPSLEAGMWAICVAVESGREALLGGSSATYSVSPDSSILLEADEPAGLRPGVLAEALRDSAINAGHTGHGETLGAIQPGERVFILDEQRPDGEPWYRVQYWDRPDRKMIVGWIDGAGFAPAAAACPAEVTLGSAATLAPYERLICFGGDLLTLEGTVIRVAVDGGPLTGVTWLAGAARDWLVEELPADLDGAISLHVDPAAPVVFPTERRVVVLGRFNDRAASACFAGRRGGDPADEVRLWCQEQFVVIAAGEREGWGPLAVSLDQGEGALEAHGGTGPIDIGERCVTLLRENGTETSLVWRSGETRWDAASRQIVWIDPSGTEIRLSDGDIISVGGAGIAPPESPDQGAGQPTWLQPPNPSCPEDLWSTHSIVDEGPGG